MINNTRKKIEENQQLSIFVKLKLCKIYKKKIIAYTFYILCFVLK